PPYSRAGGACFGFPARPSQFLLHTRRRRGDELCCASCRGSLAGHRRTFCQHLSRHARRGVCFPMGRAADGEEGRAMSGISASEVLTAGFWIVVTLVFYLLALRVQRAAGGTPLANPV